MASASAAISLAFTLFLTPVFLRWFRKWGWGQVIRTPENVHNPSHGAKRGTPTMGGTIFISGTIVGYYRLLCRQQPAHRVRSARAVLMLGFGVVGFIDDYMKVRHQNSLGLSGWRKILGQVLVVVPFAIVALNFPNSFGQTAASEYISVFRDIQVLSLFALGPILGWLLYLAWISLIGTAASNSV
ncbi:phospho-N-acetylmuramoyl-pentapeptide-transferase, partial [Microbacterium sp. SUBG005]